MAHHCASRAAQPALTALARLCRLPACTTRAAQPMTALGCAAVSRPPLHSRRIDDDTQRLSREWTRLWAVCVVITLAINGADSMLPRGCLVHDFQALFLGSWV